jgi:hypothetical protein
MPEHLNGENDELRAMDREISQLLAVEPSPDFAAKVRVRIAEQPMARGAWRFWMMAALPAAAVLLWLVATADYRTRDRQPSSVAHGDVTLVPVPGNSVQLPVKSVQDPVPNQIRSLGRTQPVAAEILVDPSLAAAVRRLAAEQPTLPEVSPEPSLDPVVVEPLKVPDIADGGTKQGDRQ